MIDKNSKNIDDTTLSEKIANLIGKKILEGEYLPGKRITETEIAEKLGFSRTPIREALRILEREGFVEILPRRGAKVTTLKVSDIEEIFLLKYRLESLAMSLAIDHINEDDLDYLNKLNEKLINLKNTENISSLIDINSRFHSYIIEKSGNKRLSRILKDIQAEFSRATAVSFNVKERINEVIEEHNDILNALKNGDKNKIEKVVEKHVYRGWQFIKNIYARQGL
ncbi:MAG: GntR family transcriptional regulator [Deferribacterota bacterium]|nr:GntR family transcriptional regulator [Deferribacterota bacterium]